MSPLIVIAANDIDVSGHSVDERLPPEWIERQLSDAGATQAAEGRARVRLSRTGRRDIVARGQVQASFSVACARCTEPAHLDVDAELTLLLKPSRATNPSPPRQARSAGGEADKAKKSQGKTKPHRKKTDSESDEYEFTSEEADVEFYDGDEVVLDPFIREAILLEIPIFPLCSEQCAGIHPGPQVSAESADAEAKRLSPLAALADFDLSKSSKKKKE